LCLVILTLPQYITCGSNTATSIVQTASAEQGGVEIICPGVGTNYGKCHNLVTLLCNNEYYCTCKWTGITTDYCSWFMAYMCEHM
jgi:hypothetical protein